MTEATRRVLWYLLKHQSILTDNIFTKIGYFWLYSILFLVLGTFLSAITDLLILYFSGLGTLFHVYVLRREQILFLVFCCTW